MNVAGYVKEKIMKIKPAVIVMLLVSLVLFSACKDNPAQQYGNTMVQSLKSTKSVESKVNVADIRKSIQEFYAANGRYPADLNELTAFNGMTLKSDQYEYDPATGALTEKP